MTGGRDRYVPLHNRKGVCGGSNHLGGCFFLLRGGNLEKSVDWGTLSATVAQGGIGTEKRLHWDGWSIDLRFLIFYNGIINFYAWLRHGEP